MGKRYEYRLYAETVYSDYTNTSRYNFGIKVIDNKANRVDEVLLTDEEIEECISFLNISNKGMLLLKQNSDFNLEVSSRYDDELMLKSYTGCASKVRLPEGTNVILRDAFRDNQHIKELELCDVTVLQAYMCRGCNQLEKVTITTKKSTNYNSRDVYIPNGAFKDCINLKEVNIGEGVDSLCNNSFAGCSRLKHITLPNTLEEIESNVFNGCISLKEITLPSKMGYISSNAFTKSCIENVYILKDNEVIPRDLYYSFTRADNRAILCISDTILNIDTLQKQGVRFKVYPKEELLRKADVVI